MNDYIGVYRYLDQLVADGEPYDYEKRVVPYLVSVWLDLYCGSPEADIVQVGCNGFDYLFDVGESRLISAWGVSRGASYIPRDGSRMRGHPLSEGRLYHRGHAIPHSMGGGTDINLVSQLGDVNVGPFRILEKQAVAMLGSLYFTFWRYVDGSQRPATVDQGLLYPGRVIRVTTHPN